MTHRLAVPAMHAAWGAALLWHPLPLLDTLAGRPANRQERVLLRLLGARHLGQAAVTAAAPVPAMLAVGAIIDLLHAASCFGLVVTRPHWRHAGGLGCLSACALATAGLAVAWQASKAASGSTDSG